MGDVNSISGIVVDRALRIHVRLGPGLMESVYEAVLERDLRRSGLKVERQKGISFEFEGLWFDDAGRADLVIEKSVVVEIKSVETLHPRHHKQLLTYMRLLDCRVGLLLNFGAALFKDGIKRVANRA